MKILLVLGAMAFAYVLPFILLWTFGNLGLVTLTASQLREKPRAAKAALLVSFGALVVGALLSWGAIVLAGWFLDRVPLLAFFPAIFPGYMALAIPAGMRRDMAETLDREG